MKNTHSFGRHAAALAFAGAAALSGFAASVPFTRTECGSSQPGPRIRALKKTWIFAERQHYWLGANVLHKWTDRPLFYNVDFWQCRDFMSGGDRAYLEDIRVLHNVRLDGFGAFGSMRSNESTYRLLADHKPFDGFMLMPILHPSDGGLDINEGVTVAPGFEAVYNGQKTYLIDCAKSPYAPRIDGKVVFWTYGNNEKTLRNWARLMRKDKDVPPFIMVGQMPFVDMYNGYGMRNTTGVLGKDGEKHIPPEAVEAYRQKVAEAARDMGGFQIWCMENGLDWNGEHPMRPETTPVYRDYLLPVATEVLNRPENKGMLVGCYIEQGYINNFEGWTKGEFGTARLRKQLDEILLINPDMFMCFEWNEENENTHFQPTVAHGKTWARVLNHYRALLDKTSPEPLPGDDSTVPNLVLSVRQSLKLGEPYHLELLFLPDGAEEKTIGAQVALRDEAGRVVVTFPQERIPTDALKAIDYRIASERFAGCQALTPELTVTTAGRRKVWKGFDTTRISPTMCNNYLYSNHPLRESLEPKNVEFRVSAASEPGAYDVRAKVECDEELASLEVVDGLNEKAAVDPSGWFDETTNAVFRVTVETVDNTRFGQGNERVLAGTATVAGAPHAEVRPSHYMWETICVRDPVPGGANITLLGEECHGRLFVRVPRTELAGAKFTLALNKIGTHAVDLDLAERLGKVRKDIGNGAIVSVERLDNLGELYAPLNVRTAALSQTVRSTARIPVFQLRAIAKSGKVWRSAPVFPRPLSAEKKEIAVFSDTERKVVRIRVPSETVPDFRYAFDPARGALLKSTWDADSDAPLGGSSEYGQPMAWAAVRHKLPADFTGKTAPDWVNTNGIWALDFAHGTYLCLPQEIIPRGAEYELSFSFKPTTTADQVLLRAETSSSCDLGLQMILKGGSVHLHCYGVSLHTQLDHDTQAKIRTDAWNDVRIVRRFDRFDCTVNGKKTTLPFDRRARQFSSHVFGSCVMPDGDFIKEGIRPFEGLLRALRVKHSLQ